MSQRRRVGGLPKNKTLHYFLNQPNVIRNFAASVLKLFIPLQLRQNIRYTLTRKNMAKVKLSPEIRSKLIEIYRSDIIQLQDLIERDLSNWLRIE